MAQKREPSLVCTSWNVIPIAGEGRKLTLKLIFLNPYFFISAKRNGNKGYKDQQMKYIYTYMYIYVYPKVCIEEQAVCFYA